MKRCITAILFALVSCGPVSAAFKPEPLPEGTSIEKMCISAYGFITGDQITGLIKIEPEYKSKPSYGMFYIARMPKPFAAYSSTGEGSPDTVIIDMNSNGDLTDEVPLVKDQAVSLTLPNGHKQRLILAFPGRSPRSLLLKPAEWYRGEIDVKGKKIAAAIVDTGMNGIKPGTDDVLLLDINGNGRIEVNPDKYELEGYAPLADTIVLLGDVWSLDFDPKTLDIKFKPYTGAAGALDLALPEGPGFANGQVMVWLATKKMAYTMRLPEGQRSSRFPAGKYEKARITLSSLPEDGGGCLLTYDVTKPMELKADGKTTLNLPKPDGLTVSVQQSGRKISVSHKAKSGEAIELSSMQVLDSDGNAKRLPAPQVHVVDTATGREVASGKMSYG